MSDCFTFEPLPDAAGVTFEIGRRSPFNSRLTENDGGLLAATSAVAANAPAIRIMSLAIEPLRRTDPITPRIDQAHENPPSQPHRLSNVRRRRAFHRREAKVRFSIFCLRIKSNGTWREQKWRLTLIMCERPFFPPPPCLAVR